MDDNAPQENPPKDFNKIDLTQLQGFSFGTQWSQEKTGTREPRRDDRPRRDEGPDRRDDRGVPQSRDRRAFRRPAGDPATATPPPAAGAGDPRDARPAAHGDGAPRREFRNEPRGDYRGGPRRDGPMGNDRGFQRGNPQERGPYDSPWFTTTFYPEDTSFSALAKTIRASCRTFELFDIAKTVIGKPDRFVVVVQRKQAPGSALPPAIAPQAPAAAPAKQSLYVSVPDSIPFETEEGAVAHVLAHHLATFFDRAEVEIDPPKGNFQVVNRDTVTSELLGPPNYHRYTQIVQQHYASKIRGMTFDAFRGRIESVRDPEVIAQWVEKMKKTTRYTWKLGRPSETTPAGKPPESAAAPSPAADPAVSPESSATPAQADVSVAPSAEPAADATPAMTPAPIQAALAAVAFDSLEEARSHLLAHARDKVVRAYDNVRFHGKVIETIPNGEIRRAVEGALERQRRFPLDTANALRGRLRREGFTIFKKGSKGVSYVCAVKRKFRVPGQVFSESIGALIAFIEANPMFKASDLASKFLGISVPTPAKPAPGSAGTPATGEGAPAEMPAPAPAPILTIEQRGKLSRMQGDLAWLVHEGYVTEFIDGRLFAPPVMVEARKKEVEAEEHDPENFPEVPAAPAPAQAEGSPAVASAEPAPAAEPEEKPAPAASAAEASPPAATA